MAAGGLLLLACLGIIVVHLGAGALTLLHNYTTIGVGQRMVNDLRGALYAHLQRLSLAYHSRQRVGDLLYRITADSFAVQTMIMNGVLPILSAAVLLGGMLVVLLPLDPTLTLLSLTRRSLAVWPDFRVQPQDRRCRDRGAQHRKPRLFRRAMGDVVDQAGPGLHQGGRGASAIYGRQRGEPAGNPAALQLADTLFGSRQPGDCRRHRARRLCRGARCHVGEAVGRTVDRFHLLSRPALRADQSDHPELGADCRRAGRGAPGFRCARHRGRSQRRGPAAFLRKERAATWPGAMSPFATGRKHRS